MPSLQQETEFERLFARNNTLICSICARFCSGDAFYFEELRQECALALWTEYELYGMSRFNGDSTESTWIYKISYHAIIDYLRRSKQISFLSFGELSDGDNIVTTDTKYDWQLIDKLKEHLNHKEQALLNHYINEDSYSTIARTEGITERAARKRMSRLINKLKILILK